MSTLLQPFRTQLSAEQSQSITRTMAPPAQGPPGPAEDHEYPSAGKVAIIMIALYLAMFLIALVSSFSIIAAAHRTDFFRIGPSLEPLSLTLPMTFTHSAMLDGTEAPIFSPAAPASLFSAASTPSTLQKSSTSSRCSSSRLAPHSVVLHQIPMPLSLVVQSLVWDLPVYGLATLSS